MCNWSKGDKLVFRWFRMFWPTPDCMPPHTWFNISHYDANYLCTSCPQSFDLKKKLAYWRHGKCNKKHSKYECSKNCFLIFSNSSNVYIVILIPINNSIWNHHWIINAPSLKSKRVCSCRSYWNPKTHNDSLKGLPALTQWYLHDCIKHTKARAQ